MAKNKKKEEKKEEKKVIALEEIFADPRVKSKFTREVGKALKVGYVKALIEAGNDIQGVMSATGWNESTCRSIIKVASALKPIKKQQ